MSTQQWDVTLTEHGGERIAAVLQVIPDAAPPAVREGLARRRIVSTTGRCPCGGRLTLPNRAERRRARKQGRVIHADVEHELECPAISPQLEQWMRGPR